MFLRCPGLLSLHPCPVGFCCTLPENCNFPPGQNGGHSFLQPLLRCVGRWCLGPFIHECPLCMWLFSTVPVALARETSSMFFTCGAQVIFPSPSCHAECCYALHWRLGFLPVALPQRSSRVSRAGFSSALCYAMWLCCVDEEALSSGSCMGCVTF